MSDQPISNRKLLASIFNRIDDLIIKGDWNTLDQALDQMPMNMDTTQMIAWLRYSSRANGNLPSWPAAVLKCANELERRKLPYREILTGLLPPKVNPPIEKNITFLDSVFQTAKEIGTVK